MLARIKRNSKCINCGFCEYLVECPGGNKICLGCGICVKGCPTGARSLYFFNQDRVSTNVIVDGERYSVPAGITVGQALEFIGKNLRSSQNCCSGGCFNCAVLVNDKLVRSCCTEILEEMEIITQPKEIERHPPLRLVSLYPNYFHASVSVFTCGCNFNCDFCHNWNITFASTGTPLNPLEAAGLVNQMIGSKGNFRIGISGGEPTLNRRWLVAFIGELKAKYKQLRIQVDTNASVLTKDYIDELYDAGMTDISPDLKAQELDTFIKITGVKNKELARRYLDTAWQSIEYIVAKYANKLHLAVGLPYHPKLISEEELFSMGKRLASLDRNIDVNLIVYQSAFRMRGEGEASDRHIDQVMSLLSDTGLKRVWCQEGEDIPRAVDPDDLALGGEDF
ncbi:radical SAM protein [Calderihabitans maritimus]|uniref:Radical SAM protein n=1 Tax=Calderihabitans maritimus TaxID=1246530 RepID=A0A1Z5HTW5_9FIRM|nr:radical SAM protein [Calderihabitans maritimus]GAW92976.1 radical SAM protein [Calderihabitans maritimus]